MSRDPFEFDDEATVVPGLGGVKNDGAGAPQPPAPQAPAQPSLPPAGDAVLGGAATPQGGATPPTATPPAAPRRSLNPQASAPATIDGPLETIGPTPLMTAAAELLLEAGVKGQMAMHPDPAGFRQDAEGMLQRFHTRARQMGIDEGELEWASFILTSLVDDVVMATPWGQQSMWSNNSLSTKFHKNAQGGEKVYVMAEQLIQQPERYPQALGLLHAAFCAGFQGQHRGRSDGRALVDSTRERVFQAYERVRPRAEGALSPRWQGSGKGHTPIISSTPLWVFVAGFGVIALIVYATLLFDLARRGNAAIAPLAQAPTPTVIAPEETPPPPPVRSDPYDQIEEILRPDIYSGRVQLENFPNAVRVTLQSTEEGELFRSGGHEPSAVFGPTLERVAQAAELTSGGIFIEGYTDNQPIRSLRYSGSNVRLSEERAASVATRVEQQLTPGRSIETRGYGADRPIRGVDQSTPAGRRLNRRVSITLSKR
ncbi:MAG: type IVB secretion system protein IcmH/DotU [Pseudomonadota bacterium]